MTHKDIHMYTHIYASTCTYLDVYIYTFMHSGKATAWILLKEIRWFFADIIFEEVYN